MDQPLCSTPPEETDDISSAEKTLSKEQVELLLQLYSHQVEVKTPLTNLNQCLRYFSGKSPFNVVTL